MMVYSQKTFWLMHHETVYWQSWDLAGSCWDEILSHRDLFLFHVSVEKCSVHTNRGQPAKMESRPCLHWNILYLVSVVTAVLLLYGCSCSRK